MEDIMTDNAPAMDTAPDGGVSREYLDNPSISKFVQDGHLNYNNLAKSYLEAQSFIGKDRIVIPKDDNDVQAWEMYDKKFGVPDTAEGYELKVPEGMDMDLSQIRGLAKQLHLTPRATQGILDAYIQDVSNRTSLEEQAKETEKANAINALKQEWGLKYNENITNANNTLKKLAGDEDSYQRMNEKWGNDPDFIKLIAKTGGLLSEGSLGGFEGQVQGFNRTPSEAKAELDRIMNDSNHPYWAGSRNHRDNLSWAKSNGQGWVSPEEHKASVELVKSLMAMGG